MPEEDGDSGGGGGEAAREVITESSRAFHQPTRLARFEVVFLGAKPAVVWRFEGLSYTGDAPPNLTTQALVDGRGTVLLDVAHAALLTCR